MPAVVTLPDRAGCQQLQRYRGLARSGIQQTAALTIADMSRARVCDF